MGEMKTGPVATVKCTAGKIRTGRGEFINRVRQLLEHRGQRGLRIQVLTSTWCVGL